MGASRGTRQAPPIRPRRGTAIAPKSRPGRDRGGETESQPVRGGVVRSGTGRSGGVGVPGSYPAQLRTGSAGYRGYAGSVADRPHSQNTEPLPDTMRRACRQLSQSPTHGVMVAWRRGWDSNPRSLSTQRFSRAPPSTARPPLRRQGYRVAPAGLGRSDGRVCQREYGGGGAAITTVPARRSIQPRRRLSTKIQMKPM